MIAHALTDAVLGAAGLGDIGRLFPSGDPRWQGADSLDLLRDAWAQVREADFVLVNADCVLVGEEPRIADRRDEMRGRLAAALGVGPERVNVRAATTDRLGFTGRARGLAAEAVALLERVSSSPTARGPICWSGAASWAPPRDEFMYHGAVAGEHWNRQYEQFPDLQLFLLGDDERLLAGSNAVPVPFGPDELPEDCSDAALAQAFRPRGEGVSASLITIGVGDAAKPAGRCRGDARSCLREGTHRSRRTVRQARSTSTADRSSATTWSGGGTTGSCSTPGCGR